MKCLEKPVPLMLTFCPTHELVMSLTFGIRNCQNTNKYHIPPPSIFMFPFPSSRSNSVTSTVIEQVWAP